MTTVSTADFTTLTGCNHRTNFLSGSEMSKVQYEICQEKELNVERAIKGIRCPSDRLLYFCHIFV